MGGGSVGSSGETKGASALTMCNAGPTGRCGRLAARKPRERRSGRGISDRPERRSRQRKRPRETRAHARRGRREGAKGFVHEVARDFIGERWPEFEYYFAGPPPMAEAVQRMLIDKRVPFPQVHFDSFD